MKQWFAALALAACAGAALAQETPQQEKKEASKAPAASQKEAARDTISTTQQPGYTARAGTIILKDEEGTPKASIFFVSYTKDGVDPAKRPITFAFNGGPGSSSVWLHLGAFGPKRVAYADDEGHAAAPPYKLVDNEASLFDTTDLVFIDPVTTGYSRAIPGTDAKKFHGVEADVESVGEFIRLYTTRYNRWASAKFIAGESYGTTRAAGLAGWLHEQGFYLNGIVLLSSILNFETARFDSGNDLPYILFLPTYAATAWYHHKLPPDLQSQSVEQVTAAAEKFALGEYTNALMHGDALTDAERTSIANQVSRFTGLSPDFVQRANLRIRIDRFDKELLREKRMTVGRLDARFTGSDIDAAGERPEFDPSHAAIMGEYTAMLNDYVRRTLRFESDLPYEVLTGRVQPWSYERQANRYLDVAETLRSAMARNPYLRVFVAAGWYDLATPFAAARYTFNRMQLEPAAKQRVTFSTYAGGHMMYIDRTAHRKLHDDIVRFMRESMPVGN